MFQTGKYKTYSGDLSDTKAFQVGHNNAPCVGHTFGCHAPREGITGGLRDVSQASRFNVCPRRQSA